MSTIPKMWSFCQIVIIILILSFLLFLKCYQDYESQMDRKRPLYQQIHEVADELVKHPKSTDVSEIKLMLTNVELNWDCLNTSLAKR